jgi:hypothetical protein
MLNHIIAISLIVGVVYVSKRLGFFDKSGDPFSEALKQEIELDNAVREVQDIINSKQINHG